MDAGKQPAAGAGELLTAARFQEELRRVARFRAPVVIAGLLDAVVSQVARNPAFTQSRLLARVLAALVSQQGEFRRAEASAFDSETLGMVIALIDAYAAGTYSPREWSRAVNGTETALLAAS